MGNGKLALERENLEQIRRELQMMEDEDDEESEIDFRLPSDVSDIIKEAERHVLAASKRQKEWAENEARKGFWENQIRTAKEKFEVIQVQEVHKSDENMKLLIEKKKKLEKRDKNIQARRDAKTKKNTKASFPSIADIFLFPSNIILHVLPETQHVQIGRRKEVSDGSRFYHRHTSTV